MNVANSTKKTNTFKNFIKSSKFFYTVLYLFLIALTLDIVSNNFVTLPNFINVISEAVAFFSGVYVLVIFNPQKLFSKILKFVLAMGISLYILNLFIDVPSITFTIKIF